MASLTQALSANDRADALEEHMMPELEHIVTKSVLFTLADGKDGMESGPSLMAKSPGKYMLMGADPRLPQMPAKPTLMDYFRCRFASIVNGSSLDTRTIHQDGLENVRRGIGPRSGVNILPGRRFHQRK